MCYIILSRILDGYAIGKNWNLKIENFVKNMEEEFLNQLIHQNNNDFDDDIDSYDEDEEEKDPSDDDKDDKEEGDDDEINVEEE